MLLLSPLLGKGRQEGIDGGVAPRLARRAIRYWVGAIMGIFKKIMFRLGYAPIGQSVGNAPKSEDGAENEENRQGDIEMK